MLIKLIPGYNEAFSPYKESCFSDFCHLVWMAVIHNFSGFYVDDLNVISFIKICIICMAIINRLNKNMHKTKRKICWTSHCHTAAV